ncbi:ABC transporter substrate-binding protein [Antribacter gilvus]|uniref:ABC transporter substrate-binding protein n=1 Tax=Antribacter gilvus TaxID=2304675 RepID=UPI0013E06174|nr:extracellular solute-binding protein [Antribacter gilvus]
MRIHRSIPLRAAAVVTVAALLAACGGAAEEPADEGSPEAVTLKLTWWGSDARTAIMNDVIASFQEEYPHITVQGEPSDFDSYFDKVATATAAGDAPDVLCLGGAYPQEYGAAGALLDLNSVPEVLDTSAFAESTLVSSTVDGTVYGLPTGGNAIGVIANTRIFSEAGVELPDDESWTWEDFTDLATEISEKHPDAETYGVEMRIQDILGVYAGQRGDGLYDWDGNLAVEKDTLVDFWTMETGLIASGAQPSAEKTVELQNVGPELTLIGTGKAGMSFAYSNLLGTYATSSGDELVILKVPGENQYDHPGATVLPSQYWGISSQSEHPEESALLVDYLVNDVEAGKLILADRGLPFNAEVYEGIKDLLDPASAAAGEYVTEVTETTEPAPPQPAGGSGLNDTTQRFEQQVIFGQLSPEEAADQWIAEMEAALAAG